MELNEYNFDCYERDFCPVCNQNTRFDEVSSSWYSDGYEQAQCKNCGAAFTFHNFEPAERPLKYAATGPFMKDRLTPYGRIKGCPPKSGE